MTPKVNRIMYDEYEKMNFRNTLKRGMGRIPIHGIMAFELVIFALISSV